MYLSISGSECQSFAKKHKNLTAVHKYWLQFNGLWARMQN